MKLLFCRPFLLPCLVSALMSGLASCSNLCLSETNPRFAAAKYTKLNPDAEASLPHHKPGIAATPEQDIATAEHISSMQHPAQPGSEAVVHGSHSQGRMSCGVQEQLANNRPQAHLIAVT